MLTNGITIAMNSCSFETKMTRYGNLMRFMIKLVNLWNLDTTVYKQFQANPIRDKMNPHDFETKVCEHYRDWPIGDKNRLTRLQNRGLGVMARLHYP